MSKKVLYNILVAISGVLIFSACGISSKSIPQPQNVAIDLSKKSPAFQDGYEDGCSTAHGEYKKDSERFNKERDYNEGWFAGRSGCNSSSNPS